MKVEGIVFDLDGTLVNSIEDISDSMNVVLKAANFPTHSYAVCQSFIGSGIRSLVEKSLPENQRTTETIDLYFKEMFDYYSEHCTIKTKPYVQINELIAQLKYLKLAVLSNKADALTKKVVKDNFPDTFLEVAGMTTEELKKPNPSVVLEMAKNLGIHPATTMYVGDTSVDIKTAKNAGMISVAVTWGYRTKEQLLAENPDYIIDSPMELLDLLNS